MDRCHMLLERDKSSAKQYIALSKSELLLAKCQLLRDRIKSEFWSVDVVSCSASVKQTTSQQTRPSPEFTQWLNF